MRAHSCILIKCHLSRRKTVERLAIYSLASCQLVSGWGWSANGKLGVLARSTMQVSELEKLLLHCSLPNYHPHCTHSPLIHLPLNKFTRHETLHTARGPKGGLRVDIHTYICIYMIRCPGWGNTSNHSTRHRLNTREAIRRWVSAEWRSRGVRGVSSARRWRPWQITFCKIGRNCQTSQIREYANASNIHTMWLDDGCLPAGMRRGYTLGWKDQWWPTARSRTQGDFNCDDVTA